MPGVNRSLSGASTVSWTRPRTGCGPPSQPVPWTSSDSAASSNRVFSPSSSAMVSIRPVRVTRLFSAMRLAMWCGSAGGCRAAWVCTRPMRRKKGRAVRGRRRGPVSRAASTLRPIGTSTGHTGQDAGSRGARAAPARKQTVTLTSRLSVRWRSSRFIEAYRWAVLPARRRATASMWCSTTPLFARTQAAAAAAMVRRNAGSARMSRSAAVSASTEST